MSDNDTGNTDVTGDKTKTQRYYGCRCHGLNIVDKGPFGPAWRMALRFFCYHFSPQKYRMRLYSAKRRDSRLAQRVNK